MRKGRRVFVVGVVLVCWGLITHGTFAGTGDEPHYQMIARSLAVGGDLDLADDYADPKNLVADGKLVPEAHAILGKDGRLRPVHDIGMPLLFAPYFAVAYRVADIAARDVPPRWLEKAKLNGSLILRHLLSLAMIAITAWIGLRLASEFEAMFATTPGVVSGQASGNDSRSLLWAALVVLSPPILSHAFLFFTEIVSAAIALWVFVRLRRDRLTSWEAAVAGAATGYLMFVHARNAGLVLGLLALAFVRLRRRPEPGRLFTWFAGGALLAIGLRTLVTYHFWGTWLTTPHARVDAAAAGGSAAIEIVTRLAGWLVDQEHGLLLYAPIYLLLPFGWWALWTRDRRLCTELSLVVASYVGVMAVPFLNPHGWRGGWSPAARFLVPVMPLLAIVAFAAVARRPRTPVVIRALVVVQVALNVMLWQHPKLLWNDGKGTSALAAYLDGGSGALSRHLPSIGR